MSKEDNIYYNITIKGDAKTGGQAIFRENRVGVIIENPSHYQLAVERFSVPSINIPILIFDNRDFKISFQFDNLTITKPLIWIPNDINVSQPKYLWHYQEMLNMINVAFESAFTDMKLAKPLAPPTEAPFLTYNPTTQLITLNAEQTYNSSGVPTINIFFNLQLFNIMPSFVNFEQEEKEPLAHQILVQDLKFNRTTFNGKPYFNVVQEFTTLSLWNDLQSIVFMTDSIPTTPELDSSQKNITQRVITDFEPLTGINDRQNIQYYPQGPLRFYDLDSSYPLRTIDLTVYWKSTLGVLYPIYINDTDVLTVKLLFRKKSVRVSEEDNI